MSWKDKLQPATFRGVAFGVDGHELTAGRRVQTHEYPQRDKPYAEDLGRATRKISVEAFLVGPDYMDARDRLLEAIEKAGPGELVHPWHGRMTVNIDGECRVREHRAEGGYCTATLAFVESGELAFPSAASAPGAQSRLAADALQQASIDEFSQQFSIANTPEFVTADAQDYAGTLLDGMDRALASASGVLVNPATAMQSAIATLLPTPTGYAQRVYGLYARSNALLSSAQNIYSPQNFMRSFVPLRAVPQFANAPRSVLVSTTPMRTQMLDNRDALATLTRQSLLVQTAGMTATMPLPVYQDGIALRNELMAALDTEASTANDTTYAALMNLRSKVHTDMTARLREAARLQQITPREVTPALALSYDLYENIERADEIVARNRLRYPGFVPAEPIRVLA